MPRIIFIFRDRSLLCLLACIGLSTACLAAEPLVPNPIRAVVSAEIEEEFEILGDGGFEISDHSIRVLSPFLTNPPTAPVAERIAAAARSGNFGYRITCGPGQHGEFSLRVDPDKAENVTLSAWVRTQGGSVTIRPLVTFENYGNMADGPCFGDMYVISTDWTELTITAATTAGFQFVYAGIEAPENSVLDVDDISVTIPVWELAEPDAPTVTVGGIAVPAVATVPVLLCFSVHIEDPQILINQESFFLKKTAVFERLASLFHSHGGYLNIQPELEWVLGAQRHGVPNMLRELAVNYDVTYSTHTHGPACYEIATGVPYGSAYCTAHHHPEDHSYDITDQHVVRYIADRREALEAASGIRVSDHNGNFDFIDKNLLYVEDVRTLSAFKSPITQKSYDYLINNPWRPSNGNAFTHLETFLTNNPDGLLVYLPGLGSTITRRHHRVEEKVRRVASQFIRYADADRINTMNLIFHVDCFKSEEDIPPNDYITVTGSGSAASITYSAEFEQHLQYWGNMLTNVIDPLVSGGYLAWATHGEMVDQYQAWELAQEGTHLVQVPSNAGGTTGIGVRVVVPETARYPEGAPVALHVQGGTVSGGLTMDGVGLVNEGFIEVYFNFPGSGDLNPSGGVFDYRGPDCLAALRDVTRFALGMATTTGDQTLAQIASPVTPLDTNVGLIGLSNGGNATLTAAGLHGTDLGGLAWIVNYESPVGDGMPLGEAGTKGYMTSGNPERNPAYDPNTGVWDMSTLNYNSALDVAGYVGLASENLLGGLYFDHNGNNLVDEIHDFVPRPFYTPDVGGVKVYYSERLTDYAAAHGLYPPSALIPDHLTTPEECSAFWLYRNGEKWIDELVTHHPQLMFLVTAHEIDHVQTALDHPHVLIQYEGLRQEGARFTRLNPDRSYVEGLAGTGFSSVVDNDGLVPFDHQTIRTATQPGGPGSVPININTAAGCCELADRTQASDVNPQIDYLPWQSSAASRWDEY